MLWGERLFFLELIQAVNTWTPGKIYRSSGKPGTQRTRMINLTTIMLYIGTLACVKKSKTTYLQSHRHIYFYFSFDFILSSRLTFLRILYIQTKFDFLSLLCIWWKKSLWRWSHKSFLWCLFFWILYHFKTLRSCLRCQRILADACGRANSKGNFLGFIFVSLLLETRCVLWSQSLLLTQMWDLTNNGPSHHHGNGRKKVTGGFIAVFMELTRSHFR